MILSKKNQHLNQETIKQFLEIKRLKPNRKRIYGRMTHHIKPCQFIAKNLEAMAESFSYLECKFFNLMLSLRSQYNVVKPSHQWIADQLDCSTTQVQNLVDRFENLGLITPVYRHMRSSIFKFSQWLRIPDVVNRLQRYFPGIRVFALAFLHVSLLLSLSGNYVRDVKLCQCIKDQDQLLNINKRDLAEAYKSCGYGMKNKEVQNSQGDKSLKGDSRQPSHKANRYGGTRLYDRKTSQTEINLLQAIHERQKRKYSMQYQSDEEAHPHYNEPTVAAERQYAYHHNTMYAPYVHHERKIEDPVEASNRLIEWTKTDQFKKAEALMGRDVALKMCNKIVSQAIEESR